MGSMGSKNIDRDVIIVTAKELVDTEEGKILLALYKCQAYDGNTIRIDELKNKIDVKRFAYRLNKLKKLNFVKEVKPLVGVSRYVGLTELGKTIAEEMINLK